MMGKQRILIILIGIAIIGIITMIPSPPHLPHTHGHDHDHEVHRNKNINNNDMHMPMHPHNNDIDNDNDGSAGVRGTLLLYSYFEDASKPSARSNLEFFIEVALVPLLDNPLIDIVIICNSITSVPLPIANNVYITTRRNYGMDLCAYNQTLSSLLTITGRLPSSYRYHCWMNASVRGPFLPWSAQYYHHWLSFWTNQINDHDKLIGTSITCMDRRQYHGILDYYDRLHVQSMFLVFDYIVYPLLVTKLICSNHRLTTIFEGEVQLSRVVLHAGYNLAVQLMPYRGIDWTNRNMSNDACDRITEFNGRPHGQFIGLQTKQLVYTSMGDFFRPNVYGGNNVNPFEVVMFKSNRGVTESLVDQYSSFLLTSVRYRRQHALPPYQWPLFNHTNTRIIHYPY